MIGPVDGVGEHNEADHGIASGLGENGELACRVGIEGTGGSGFGSVVDGQASPEAISAIAEVKPVANQRESEKRQRA